jgi:4-aminobutyrate aminotransferase/4-aminobutyrate aminotransferase/(S)-3-amino-2-methylpropionate transaminase
MRSFFCASGSEAVEGALLTAALHTGRHEVVAMTNGLHGRTKWAINATGLPMWRTDPAPLDTVHHVPFGDADALRVLLTQRGDRIAAVIGEPVQGNGGIIVPSADYWPAVRELCNAHGALLVFDEIQTGMNRTGKWFACEHWGVEPDIMAISKALGNGFPIAAFIATDKVACSYTRPGASTYGGNPVCAAAALATIRFHERYQLGRQAAAMGNVLRDDLDSIARRSTCLRRPRGLGLMIGMDVVDAAGEPDPARLDAILEQLKDRGVLAGKTGADRHVLTFLPPLTISPDESGELIDALEQVVL